MVYSNFMLPVSVSGKNKWELRWRIDNSAEENWEKFTEVVTIK